MELFILIALLICVVVTARRFKAHDHVGIVANTVGPFNNPTETYPVRLTLSFNFILFD